MSKHNQPDLVVTSDGKLVDGNHRMEAVRKDDPHSFEGDTAWDDCSVCGRSLMHPIHQGAQ